MKMNHLTHNVSRLLSLLLVVAALAGLLTVGALADETTASTVPVPTVTLTAGPLEQSEEDPSVYTADISYTTNCEPYKKGSSLSDNGIVAVVTTLEVSSGFEVVEIAGNEERSVLIDGNSITYAVASSSGSALRGYISDTIATVTVRIKSTACGEQKIGFSTSTTKIGYTDGEVVPTFVPATITIPGATLTFNMNGHGDAIDPVTVAVGGTVTEPVAPTAIGYTFGCWCTDEACNTKFNFGKLDKDTTVYAKWTANKVNVTLDANGGEYENTGAEVTYDGTYGALPTPVKTGHTFLGWYDGDTKIEATTKVTKADAHTLTAMWKINEYTITLDANGGKCDKASIQVEYGKTYGELPTPTWDGWIFNGWFTAVSGGTKVGADTKAVENCTIYAQWTEMGKINLDKTPQKFTYGDTGIKFDVNVGKDDPKGGYFVSYLVDGTWTEAAPTAAGTYQVKVSHVAEGDFEAFETTIMDGLVIEKATVKEPAKDTNEFTYDGAEKTYTVAENALYTVSGNKQTNAGEYKVTIELADAANYKWEAADNSEALKYDFVIAKAKVAKPTADTTEFTYDGSEKTYTLAESDKYTVSKNTTQKNAGTYTLTVSLKDTANYQWADGSTEALTYTFTIAKAENKDLPAVKVENETIYKLADGKITGVDNTMEYSADNGTTWTKIDGKLEDLKAGDYQVRYAESDNYLASAAVTVTVGKGKKLTATFVTNEGTEVEPQTGLGYKDALDSSKATTTRTGYTFDGWYKEEALKNAWDFATARMDKDDITLYAKWSYSVAVSGSDSFTTGSEPEAGLTIEIGKGLDLTKDNLKEVEVDGKKLDETDYTVSDENGLTVTLSKEFLATLKTGEHKVGIKLDGVNDPDNAKDLSVSFTIKAKAAANGGTTGTGKKAPHTGDSSDLLLWSVVTLGAGAGLVCIGKKRREN